MAFHQESALGIVINLERPKDAQPTRISWFILIHCSCSQPRFLMEKDSGGMRGVPKRAAQKRNNPMKIHVLPILFSYFLKPFQATKRGNIFHFF